MKKLIFISLISILLIGCQGLRPYLGEGVVERMQYVYDPSVDMCYGVSTVEGHYGIAIVPIPCWKIPKELLITKDKTDPDRIDKEIRRKLPY